MDRSPDRKLLRVGVDTIHYADFGGPPDAPAAVLVHGLGGSHVNWFAVAPKLAETHRTYAIDVPGFGLSPRPETGTNVPGMLRAIAAFADNVSPERPIVLFGNSMGGALSILYGAENARRVAATVLVCPAVPHPHGVFPDRAFMTLLLLAAAPFGARLFGARARKATPEALVYEMLKLTCVDRKRVPRAVIDEAIALARTRHERPWMDQAFTEATRSVLRTVLVGEKRMFDALRRTPGPTLLIHGAKDRLVDVRAAELAATKSPSIELRILDDIGHTPQLEAPTRFLELVLPWLGAVAAARPAAA
ncbi:MAG: alpha/beta hydrolase [Polyangiaceae bacterium]